MICVKGFTFFCSAPHDGLLTQNAYRSFVLLPPFFSSWFYYLALVNRELLPVGSAYVAHVRRAINNHTFEQHDELAEEQRRQALLNGNGENEEDDLGVGDEPEPWMIYVTG